MLCAIVQQLCDSDYVTELMCDNEGCEPQYTVPSLCCCNLQAAEGGQPYVLVWNRSTVMVAIHK